MAKKIKYRMNHGIKEKYVLSKMPAFNTSGYALVWQRDKSYKYKRRQ